MSTHLVGFKPADEKYRAMIAARNACKAAKVQLPQEVVDFFGGSPWNADEADPLGVMVDIERTRGVKGWKDDSRTISSGKCSRFMR